MDTPAEMERHIGRTLGASDWTMIDQTRIDAFAALTGDRHWIHVDVERAAREMPGGKTIAHGFLLLSLVPHLQGGIFRISRRGKGLNYGCNRVRFTSPVPVDSHVRLHQSVKAFQRLDRGVRITFDCTFEIDGRERPALVAETMVQIDDE
jgi:acyl dehydratase